MKKEKKEPDQKVSSLQSTGVVPATKSKEPARQTEQHYVFSRYAFDTNGGGYQGL